MAHRVGSAHWCWLLLRPFHVGTLVAISIGFVFGCNQRSEFPLAPVSGTVVFDGQPVTAGHLQFAPAGNGGLTAGKVATAAIKGDGSFTFGSYTLDDGAVIGAGRLMFLEPASTETPPADAVEKRWRPTGSPYAGLVPKEPDVTIIEGPNTLVVELVRP